MKHLTTFASKTVYNTVKDKLAWPNVSLAGDEVIYLPMEHGPEPGPTYEMVDLGLSVKWAKYNLGATHENTPESWYGDYYAWGETETKSDYSSDTYSYSENPTTLPADHDAATVKQDLRMPTKAELEELKALPNEWITNYNGVSGLNGRVFRGNDNELFIPTAGFYRNSDLYNTGDSCSLWTSSLDTDTSGSYYAWVLSFGSDSINISSALRFYGRSVRGVCE